MLKSELYSLTIFPWLIDPVQNQQQIST